MKYFLDTNIFIRFFTGDNKKQFTECMQLIQKVKLHEIEAYTNSLVLAEIVWTLGTFYNFSKKIITDRVESIVSLNNLSFTDRTDPRCSIDLFIKHPVKYIDTLIASLPDIRNKQMIVVSYDSDFGKLPVLWKKPIEVKVE